MHDDDPSIPVRQIIAGGLWAGSLVLLLLGWFQAATHRDHYAAITGDSALLCGGVAAVLTVRCFALRAMRLMRVLAEEDRHRDRPHVLH